MSINDKKLLLISGDSEGFVRYHDLIRCEQNIIFHETGYQIIQIEFIDCKTLLISSSLRTVVIEFNFCDNNNQNIVTQIGKNERKTFGKYGAVYSIKSNIIYGSRPSLHLIKAEVNGNVSQTIRLNNVIESKFSQRFEEFSEVIEGQTNYKLGLLKLFCNEDYILSWNDSNLLIIRSDGHFCLKEKINKLIDVKIAHRDSNEAFLLLDSKYVIRIRNKNYSSCLEFEESSDSESRDFDENESIEKSTESNSSTESILNRFKTPLNMNAISFIDEELKKAFDKLQVSVTKKFDKLSASIISTIDSNILSNSNQNIFVTPVYDNDVCDDSDENDISESNDPSDEVMSPLVIQSKSKRRFQDKKTNAMNSQTYCTDNEEVIRSESITNNYSSNDCVASNETSKQTIIDNSENNDSTDDNRLLMILSAYKEGNDKNDDLFNNFQSMDNQFFYSTEISDPKKIDSKQIDSKQIDSTQIDVIDSRETESVDNKANEQREESINTVKSVNFNWEKVFNYFEVKQQSSDSLLSFCAFGYNSQTEIGLIWFISKTIKDKSLIYYPSFNELKLSKGFVLQITASAYELYVLNNCGLISKREGMDATKPLGTKWTNIKMNKSKCKITSISLNLNKSILWCCDENGETWTQLLKQQKWSMINDFSSHSIQMKKVCVSLNDSTIVWGIDKSGKIFVRIFEPSGDSISNEISGDNWLLIDGILAKDLVVCNDDSVWIVVEGNKLYRRNGQIFQDENDDWEEVIGPLLLNESYSSISGNYQYLNN
jgi:hypothetical protein